MTTKLWSKQLLQVQPLQYVLASDEALAAELSEGDTVLVNDGMGRTEYRLTGFPTGTTEQGDFTVSATIAKIQESDGIVFYRTKVKWPKSTAYFVFNIDEDADIEFYGDGSSTDVHIVASEDEATIDSDAGLTESNSLYRGDYALLPKVEPLPDCTYRMEASGEAITAADTPRVYPKSAVFSLVQIKENRQRFVRIAKIENVRELLARSFTITPTPADANITYTLMAEGNTYVQQNGTVYGYAGESVTYRMVRQGYKTLERTFDFTKAAVDVDLPITMDEMGAYYFVYPNGTFAVGDFVLLNNGVGENTQEWTANPTSDTAYEGPFTQQGEVTAIDPNTGYLTVEADPLDEHEISVVGSQDGASIKTFGDTDNADVNIVVAQDASPQLINAFTVGQLTNIDGEYSGFDDNHYIMCRDFIQDASALESFTIITAIKLSRASTGNDGIIDSAGTSGSVGLRLTTSASNTVRFRVSTDGETTYPIDIVGLTQIPINSILYIKVEYSSAVGYSLYTSTNGSSWTLEGSSQDTNRPYISQSRNHLRLGDNKAAGLVLGGSLYINHTEFTVNGATIKLYGTVSPEIKSTAGLETVSSTINGYRDCMFEDLTNYTLKIQSGGIARQANESFLVKSGEIVSCVLKYNNKIVHSVQEIASANSVIRRSQTVNFNAVQSIDTAAYNFAVNNYLKTKNFPSYGQGSVSSFKFKAKVKTGSVASGSDRIWNDGNSYDDYAMGFTNDGNGGSAWFNINGSNAISGVVPWTANTVYWFEYTYENGVYTGKYSLDGVSWTTFATNSSGPSPRFTGYNYTIGGRAFSAGAAVCVWSGTIYLNELVLEVNGAEVYRGTSYTVDGNPGPSVEEAPGDSVPNATIKLYGATISSINAYPYQSISYEISAPGYVTKTGTYTVPSYNQSSLIHTAYVVVDKSI